MSRGCLTPAACLILLLAGQPASSQSRQFLCSDGETLVVRVVDAQTISAQIGERRARSLQQDAERPMTFTAGRVALEIARNQATVRITQPGAEDINCLYRPAGTRPGGDDADAASFPARSWGGIVRSGPGMEFDKLASLREGDPIVILSRTEVVMNGYPWFRIEYGDRKTGFQWGGIICAVGGPVDGTFETCR
jgi:hypothetical protein